MVLPITSCYRHPDRRAGVSCQRCSRPICPSCMTQASVGFHCPECVATASRGAPQVRAPWQQKPVLTQVLIAVNVAAYFASTGTGIGDWSVLGHGVERTGSGIAEVGVAAGEWWRLVTGAFLHANLLHLAMNMYALWILGGMLERGLGVARYLGIYAAALFAGSLGVMLVSPTADTVGASGAVFGLMGAAVAVQRSRGIDPWSTGIGGLIAINLLITFLVPGISAGGHVGGLLGGLATGTAITTLDARSARAGTGHAPDSRVVALAVLLSLAFAGAAMVAAANWADPVLGFLDHS